MFNTNASPREGSHRSLLSRQVLAAAFKAYQQRLPEAPVALPALLDAIRGGLPGALSDPAARDALTQIRASLFYAPGHDNECLAMWHESLATAAFAARVARLRRASPAAAACGGLLHRGGEALALRTLARAERHRRMMLDGPSRREWCTGHGPELSERLVREWHLPAEVATCVLGWRRFGEFIEVSPESAAVYFGRLFAIELLNEQFCVPGALDQAAEDLGLGADAVASLREAGSSIREWVHALD